MIDISGQRFGRLVALTREYNHPKRGAYWKCQCDCGNIATVSSTRLRNGNTQSCGCYRKDFAREIGKQSTGKKRNTNLNVNSALNETIKHYEYSAKRRNLEFHLSTEQLLSLFSSNCYYCNTPPSNKRIKDGWQFFYNGIDRVDNKLGYIADNVVPCCKKCNYAKNNMPQNDFKEMIIRIYNEWASRS